MKVKRKKIRVKRKSTLRNELRYLLLITVICLVLAFVLVFVTDRVPSFLDRTIQKQEDRIAGEKMEDIEKGMIEKAGKENIDNLIKKYKDKAKAKGLY
ncbi:MAG: hypothetical protein JRD69_01050 [Deltaproteobacteria bacterium]|nr:hypothetical protein [Deltaproteobacteria bacterium]